VDGTSGIVPVSTEEGASVGVGRMAVALPGTKEDISVVGTGVTDGSDESEATYVELGCGDTVDSAGREVGNSVVDKTRELGVKRLVGISLVSDIFTTAFNWTTTGLQGRTLSKGENAVGR
jgi:hypothetical protein